MLRDIGLALWFFLPAGAANAAPILVAKLPLLKRWDTPIDGGRLFRGKQLLGPHKTWRGIAAGIMFGTVTLWLQQTAAGHAHLALLTDGVNYAALPVPVLGPLFGIGALGGDAVESFFKRRRGVPSGHTWFPFDQADYIIGSILATLPVVRLRLMVYACAILAWTFLSLIGSYIGHKLSLKEQPL